MQMDTKQTALLVVTIAAFGYLGYQIYGLIKGDMKQPSPKQLVRSNNGPVAVANAAEVRSPSRNAKVIVRVPQKQMPQAVTVNQKPLLTEQKAYLNLVNQYELAKMKRRLLEEKAAIAAAQHRIASLNQQTHEIDNSLSGQAVYDDTNASTARKTTYQLSYIDHQNGEWSATLNRKGRYYQVHSGSKLDDGSKVTAINRNSVTLKNAHKRQRITFDGTVLLPEEKTKVSQSDATKKQLIKSNTPKVADVYKQARQALTTTSILKHKKVVQQKPAIKIKKAMTAATATKKTHVETPEINKANSAKIIKPVALKPTKLKPTELKPAKKLVSKKAQHLIKIHYTEDERRILTMPKKSYTIQLIGSYHRDIVENFAIANDLGNRAMQFYVLNRGKRWYVLLYGSYPTRQAAQRALKDLPPDLTPEDPWVREISAVQRDIRHHKHVHKSA